MDELHWGLLAFGVTMIAFFVRCAVVIVRLQEKLSGSRHEVKQFDLECRSLSLENQRLKPHGHARCGHRTADMEADAAITDLATTLGSLPEKHRG